MRALTRSVLRARWLVIAAWVLLIVGVQYAAVTVGSDYRNEFSLEGTDSQAASDLIADDFDGVGGGSDTVVWEVGSGTAVDDDARETVEEVLDDIAGLDGVAAVGAPWDPAGASQVSDDERIAYAVVQYDSEATEVDLATIEDVVEGVEEADAEAGIAVAVGGQGVSRLSAPELGVGELIGVGFAAVVLVLALGSLVGMILPIFSAIASLGVSTAIVSLLSQSIAIADTSNIIGVILGLGVGIDYALFIVNRHRTGLLAGRDVESSIVAAADTSGRAVVFAGITVCIALFGMFVPGIPFLYGVAIGSAVSVACTVLAAMTLLPALLRVLGLRLLGRRARQHVLAGQFQDEHAGRVFDGWARRVARHPVVAGVLAVLVVGAVAVPVLDLRLGTADQGNDPDGTTTREAYDLLSEGFGPGFNGPLLVAVDASDEPIEQPEPPAGTPGDGAAPGAGSPTASGAPPVPEELEGLTGDLRRDADVERVVGPLLSDDGTAALYQVFPETGPQDVETEDLIDRLRSGAAVEVADEEGYAVHIGGPTATFADFADEIAAALPAFFAFVIGLSFLLLVLAFRSLLIPLVGAVLNLLSAGAAFGIIVAVFQWGWGAELLGISSRGGPIEPFIPVILFAILFGLSMDYQVFLVSRIAEEWHRRRDNAEAVRIGHAETGRVVLAAASIMVFVFGAFVTGDSRTIKLIGFGLASAILIDAVVIRMVIVPAVMRLLGRANWWLPRWLDRVLPRISVEGSVEPLPAAAAVARDSSVLPVGTAVAGGAAAHVVQSGSPYADSGGHETRVAEPRPAEPRLAEPRLAEPRTAEPRRGYRAGYDAGYQAGYRERYEQGYAAGYAEGAAMEPEDRWRIGFAEGRAAAFAAEAVAERGESAPRTEGEVVAGQPSPRAR